MEKEESLENKSKIYSSVELRRRFFIKELFSSKCNAAEAARRCGYSRKYAKQIGYRILRSIQEKGF